MKTENCLGEYRSESCMRSLKGYGFACIFEEECESIAKKITERWPDGVMPLPSHLLKLKTDKIIAAL